MKVNLNLSTSRLNLQKQENVRRTNVVTAQNSVSKTPNYGVISFSGNKNPEQVLLLTAETKPYFQVGGVATVVDQYPESVFNGAKNTPIIMPYYNGKLQYDKKTGEAIGASMLMKDGKPIMTNANLKKVALNDIPANKYWELEEVIPEKTMDFAGRDEKFSVYKVKDKNHYVVYTKETAMLSEPYADGSYSSELKKQLGKNRDGYAKFNKAVAEALPELEQKAGISPKAIVLNDAQTAYFPEYIAQKVKSGGGDYFKDINLSFVQHNLGAGYQQIQSARQMFLNFATKEQIEAVLNDPKYIETLKRVPGEGVEVIEEYFKPMVKKFVDADGKLSASMIPLQYAKNGQMAHINTVSEMYMENGMKNPVVAPGLTKELNVLNEKGVISGILNGMAPNSIDPSTPIKYTIDGKEVVLYKTFKPTDDVKTIADVKKFNKISFLEKLGEAGSDITKVAQAECADPAKVNAVYGAIDPSIAKALKDGEDIKLFTTWGRGDLQKGFDNVLEAFAKFSATKDGKKAVLVAGGKLNPSDKEAAHIVKILKRMSENPELKGRFIYIDGFATNKVFGISADATIFPSRFAPCELTDLESMRLATSPIVTDIEGLAQKNLDVRDGLDKATGYKIKPNYHMLPEELAEISPEFKKGYEALVAKFEKNIAAKKLELELAGADTSCIKTMQDKMEAAIKKSPEFDELWRKYVDKAIVDDLADIMALKVKETPEVTSKLMQNCLAVKSGWDDNNGLHLGLDKSSKQLYKERHLDAKMATPDKPFFEFDQTIFKRAKKGLGSASSPVVVPNAVTIDALSLADDVAKDAVSFGGWNVKQAANNAVDSTRNLLSEATTYTKNLMRNSLAKKIALSVAGVAALGAGLYCMFKPEKDNTKHASTYVA